MKTKMILAMAIAGSTAMLVSCSTAPRPQKPHVAQAPCPSAEALLKRMARAYASVNSYADSGVVYDYRDGVRNRSSISFRIHYLRPDHLRFEMTSNIGSPFFKENYQVFWSYGNPTYSWDQHYPRVVTCRDVTSVINGFTGISGRSVHNIPSLFQKNFGWQEYLYDITSPRVVGEEVFENVECYRLQGEGKAGRQFEIWLGKSDYFIRKVQTTYPKFSSEEIHRGIAIDQPISPEMLSFTPAMSVENDKKN